MYARSAGRARRLRPMFVGSGRRVLLAGVLTSALLASMLPTLPARVEAATVTAKPPVEKPDHDGGPVSGKAWSQKRVKDTVVPAPVWPKPTTQRVDLSTAAAGAAASRAATPGKGLKAGDLPVWVNRAAGKDSERLSTVDVQVVDRKTVPQQWRDGVVMRVSTPQGTAAGAANLSIDFNAFRYAAGGSWASRLRLWQVPQCALSTPNAAACRSVALPTTVDLAAGIASARIAVDPTAALPSLPSGQPAVKAAEAGSLVVLAAAASGKDGDFGATTLAPSASWSGGGNAGNFTWNYPMRVPPATGPTPSIGLGYSSSAVDGRSEVTNNQPSRVGEGFDDSFGGFIERRYVPCAEDSKNNANSTKQSGDLCWRSDNATMSLGGDSGELIFQAGKGWHSRAEDGSKIEKLTGASNGDLGDGVDGVGEHWKVTTTDGTQYFFGLDNLPGQSAETNSTLTVPVFGNHAGEPCHASKFTDSDCRQAWRWNLDYVVDVRGNTMSFWYGKETNKYAQNVTAADDVSYDRAGYLTRIDYGTYDRTDAVHGVTERNTTPTGQVVFGTDMRCFSNCGTEADPVTASWKDTPFDQECKASATSCPDQFTPTFWSTKRLKTITTRVWDTTKPTPVWQDVESWTLSHTFSATADSTHTGLWLDKIDHAGLVGGVVNLPPVTFEAVSLANRVLTEHGTSDNWLRIASIVTETGAKVKVDYSEPDCTAAIVASLAEEANTRRCYPVKVPDPNDPDRERLLTQWWHKYVVTHIAEDDLQVTDGHPAPTKHTRYEYIGDPAWHYADDDGLSKPDRKTWDQWRGYAQVNTQVGDEPDTRTLTVTRFMRGMHGDRARPSGGTRTVTMPASLGSETVYDEDQFAGQVREQVTYNGVDTKPVSKTVNVPWRSGPTASRTINGDLVEARFTDIQSTYTATALGVDGSRGWRTTRDTSSFDGTYATTNWTQDDGDITKTGDEKCTTYGYNRNTAKNLTETVRRTTTTALACGTDPTSVDDVISDAQVSYDGAASVATPPVFGSVTKTEQLKDWTSAAGTVWQTVAEATYDPAGRAKTSTDIKRNVTETTYTPTVGGPLTKTSTKNALGWTASAEVNPYWGSTTKSVDPNGKITAEVEYDPLGRVSKVWDLGWTKAAHDLKPSETYTYSLAANRDNYPYVMSQAMNPAGLYMTSYQIMDALLRPRQTQSLALNGSGDRVVTDTIYDEFGRGATTYAPHLEPGMPQGRLWVEPEWSVPAITKTLFDRASRPTNSIFMAGDNVSNLVEKWRTVTAYEGDLTKVTPPQGATPTTTVTDIQGRVVALRQHTTAAGVQGPYQETTYHFNRKDQADKTTDTAGNEWTSRYDAKGRLYQTSDPDKGVTTSGFNDADELESTTDARGEKLWYVYDQIGRKTQLRDDSPTGPLRAKWRYDALDGSTRMINKGQLTQTVRYEPAGSANAYKWDVRTFNERYQPDSDEYVIPDVETGLAGTYVYVHYYSDATGTPTTTSYPAGGGLTAEPVTTSYHPSTGMPIQLSGSMNLSEFTMAAASYTAFGERSGSAYKMPNGANVEDIIYRDEFTRRINRTVVKRPTLGGTVSDRNYSYDDAGNITSVEEKPEIGQADTQCFRQDPLGRLNTAWTPKTGVGCSTDPTEANLGGPAPYWQDWTFDPTGSRLTETSHTTTNQVDRKYTVPTGGPAVVRPHAVTGLTTATTGQPTVDNQYRYDSSGNTTCRPAAENSNNNCDNGANSQTLGWDTEGELATISAGANTTESNIYDADGNRLIRRDTAGTTLYLPGQEIRREGTVTTGTRYYSLAGTVFASRKGSSAITDVTWLFNDHQGTQQIAINAGTLTVDIRRQTPYGGPRGTNPTWPNQKGFVGGDNDPTGLVNIGARQYDQTLGRFISVDPIMDLADPQQWNGYAYAGNNPVVRSDPSGLWAKDPDLDDQFGRPKKPNTGHSNHQSPRNSSGNAGGGSSKCDRKCVMGHNALGNQDVPLNYMKSSGYLGSPKYTNQDASNWAQQSEDGWKFLCHWVLGGNTDDCAAHDPYLGHRVDRKLNAGDAIIAGGAIALVCAAAFIVFGCLAAAQVAGAAVVSFYGFGGGNPEGEGAAGVGARKGCSFDPATPVLMADGDTKRIDNVKVGDLVSATDPANGKIVGKRVTALHDDLDTDMADVTVADAHGHRSVVHTTQNHPFWDATTHRWTRADHLHHGDHLKSTTSATVDVVEVHTYTQPHHRLNLTVDTLHTYYVLAGKTPVLVHNCPSGGDGVAPRDVHGLGRTAERGVDVDHVWKNGEMYIQEDGQIVKVLDNGNGTSSVVVRDMSNPSGAPTTTIPSMTSAEIERKIERGIWE